MRVWRTTSQVPPPSQSESLGLAVCVWRCGRPLRRLADSPTEYVYVCVALSRPGVGGGGSARLGLRPRSTSLYFPAKPPDGTSQKGRSRPDRPATDIVSKQRTI